MSTYWTPVPTSRVPCERINIYSLNWSQFMVPMKINLNDKRALRRIVESNDSIGTESIPIPFPQLKIVVDIDFRIMKENTPHYCHYAIWYSMDLKLAYGRSWYNLAKTPNYYRSTTISLCMSGAHMTSHAIFLSCRTIEATEYILESHCIRISQLLKIANTDCCDAIVRSEIKSIPWQCTVCFKHWKRERRLKISLGYNGLRFKTQ